MSCVYANSQRISRILKILLWKILNMQKFGPPTSKFYYKYFICFAKSFEIKLWPLILHPWLHKHSSPRNFANILCDDQLPFKIISSDVKVRHHSDKNNIFV